MQSWINHHPLLFACVVLAGIFVFRWWLLNLIATVSGWKALARRFSAQQPFSGTEWRWQSARLRYATGYNNALVVGADQTGLFIRTMLGLRTGHPPLFIPWNEITVEQGTGWMGQYVRLRLGRSEQVPFTIRPALAEKLQATAGPVWPGLPQAQKTKFV